MMILQDPFEGNFRAILSYRAEGDENLCNHLLSDERKNKYLSPLIQNKLIEACYQIIRGK